MTERKTIAGQHVGMLLGVPATGKRAEIDVIEVVRVKDGRYVEHWGLNSSATVLAVFNRDKPGRRP